VLKRLEPEQAFLIWELVKKTFEMNHLPITEGAAEPYVHLLEAVAKETAQVWIAYHEESKEVFAVLLTMFVTEEGSQCRNLLIYSIHQTGHIPVEEWQIGLEVLKKYARSRGASRVIAYTDVPRVIEQAKKLGADTSYTLITMEI
jgi:hypothetical protein